MTIALESMAVEMPAVEGHPNRAEFRGVLTVVDAPSQRAPSGSKGRRVMLTKTAAEEALPSLLGMAVDYAPALNAHDQQRKVGVITEAEIVPLKPGSADPAAQVTVGGFLYEHDFPDVVEKLRAGQGNLGMSYEIAVREIVSKQSPIWVVTEFAFTGAAVLRRENAAYPETRFGVGQVVTGN